MLQMYVESSNGINVDEDSAIVFSNNTINAGCTATANTPSNTVKLRDSGVYKVDFNAVISNNESATETIGIIMENNGVEVPEAQTKAASSSTTDVRAVSFSTLVRVRPRCCSVDNTARLKFKVTGADALLYFANVVITKIA